MKNLILFFLICFVPIFGFDFQWYQANSLSFDQEEQMKEVFVKSFLATYRYSGAYTNLTDAEIEEYLASDFDKILRPNLHRNDPQHYLEVTLQGKLIAYALFEKIAEDTIYIAELAVNPDFWRKKLGSQMTFSILEKEKHIRKIVLLTEKINKLSQKFYESLGFKSSTYMHEGYSTGLYCAYEKEFWE